MMYQIGTRAVQPIVCFIQGYCKCIWFEIAFVFLLNGLLYSVQSKRLLIHIYMYTEWKSKHMRHTLVFGDWSLITGRGGGGGYKTARGVGK